MKLKLSPRVVRFAYHFFDLEASAEAALPDVRMIEYAFVIQKLDSIPKGKVLDVGCTARLNYLPAALASLGWEVWGIDLRVFKFKHSSFHFILGDIRDTSFPDNFFDAAYAVSTIEHIGLSGRYGITREDLEGDSKAVREIARMLSPGGTLLCTVPYGREAKIIRPVHRVYDKSSLEKLFHDWVMKDEIYYLRKSDAYWVPLSKDDAAKVDNPDGNSAVALLELIPV